MIDTFTDDRAFARLLAGMERFSIRLEQDAARKIAASGIRHTGNDIYRVPSATSKAVYIVNINSKALSTCTCPNRGKSCWHVAACRELQAAALAAELVDDGPTPFDERGEFGGELSIPAEDVFVFEPTPFDGPDSFEGAEGPNPLWRRDVEDSGFTYDVIAYDDGTTECSCRFFGTRGRCNHTALAHSAQERETRQAERAARGVTGESALDDLFGSEAA